jgi:hypothetical protein
MQNAGPFHDHVTGGRAQLFHAAARGIRQVGADESAHLLPEDLVGGTELKLHEGPHLTVGSCGPR